jgi:hypothetical protein
VQYGDGEQVPINDHLKNIRWFMLVHAADPNARKADVRRVPSAGGVRTFQVTSLPRIINQDCGCPVRVPLTGYSVKAEIGRDVVDGVSGGAVHGRELERKLK